MKRTTKKSLVFATALAILFFGAPGAQAGGIHDVRTRRSNDSPARKFSGTQPNKKFIAHKRRKSFKSRQSKDRTTNSFPMIMGKGA
ncbi:MAG: hypothetical protein IT342_17545 [Candidatus Melainabacteria bacterium]|nr:hypothetical protein [Candidatus Melainabacteria bacterium]